jgi:hypothetical protein
MTSLCTCVFVYIIYIYIYVCVCALVLRFSSFALSNRETRTQPWQHKGDQAGRDFFFDIYIYFSKKKRETACCWCWRNVGDCCCCFRSFNALLWCPDSFLLQPSFSRSPSIDSASFSFLFFLLSFFLAPLSFFFLLSPWVMSNLRVLCI